MSIANLFSDNTKSWQDLNVNSLDFDILKFQVTQETVDYSVTQTVATTGAIGVITINNLTASAVNIFRNLTVTNSILQPDSAVFVSNISSNDEGVKYIPVVLNLVSGQLVIRLRNFSEDAAAVTNLKVAFLIINNTNN